MKKIYFAVIAILMISCAGEKNPEELLRKSFEEAKKVETAIFTVTYSLETERGKEVHERNVVVKRHDKDSLNGIYFMITDTDSTRVFFNGSNLTILDDRHKKAVIENDTETAAKLAATYLPLIEHVMPLESRELQLKDTDSLSYNGTAKVDGVSCEVVRIIRKEPYRDITYYIGRGDYYVRKSEISMETATKDMRRSNTFITGLRTGITVPDSAFNPSIPEGYMLDSLD